MNELIIMIAACFGFQASNTVSPQVPIDYGVVTNRQRVDRGVMARIQRENYKRYRREELEAWNYFLEVNRVLKEGD